MSKSDQGVIIAIALFILLYTMVWAIGYFSNKLTFFAAVLNLFAGASIIIYWAVKQLSIKQHTIEVREIIVLGFEVVVIAGALYGLAAIQKGNWFKISQYFFFSIHFVVLIAALIFMLTFKMNKLM